MSEDIFIKNPNRAATKPAAPYEPEHIRLNKKVIPMGGDRTLPEQLAKQSENIDTEMFASVDGEIFSPNGEVIEDNYSNHIIDNNEFIAPINILEIKKTLIQTEIPKEENNIPSVGDYILMVFGKIILTGNFYDIEEKVKAIIYGEDNSFSDKEVKTDDIVVLKRLAVKAGVFIDE
jgi:hypothetical protein